MLLYLSHKELAFELLLGLGDITLTLLRNRNYTITITCDTFPKVNSSFSLQKEKSVIEKK